MASVKFYKNDIAYPKVLADKLNKLADMPDAMEFKGSLGVGGTITALPVDGSAKKGDTYKVITDGTYAGQTAKVGDLFICNGKTASSNTWVLIPSGDEPSGTVTSVKIEANAPISVNNSTPITSSGTRTISHNTSGVGAGSYGPTADVVGTNNTTIKVPQITVDTYGHITSIENKTYTSKDTHNSHALSITNGNASSQSQGTTITYVESVSGCSATSGNLSGSTVRKSITVPVNTDYQVQQSSITTDAEYCLLAKAGSGTSNATVTSTTIFNTGVTVNANTGTISASHYAFNNSDNNKISVSDNASGWYKIGYLKESNALHATGGILHIRFNNSSNHGESYTFSIDVSCPNATYTGTTTYRSITQLSGTKGGWNKIQKIGLKAVNSEKTEIWVNIQFPSGSQIGGNLIFGFSSGWGFTKDTSGPNTSYADTDFSKVLTVSTTSLVAEKFVVNGGTNKQILLADGTTKDMGTSTATFLRNDGTWATPPGTSDTHRPIQMNGTQILGNNTTPLNLSGGTGITLANASGKVTFTNTMATASTWDNAVRGIPFSTSSSTVTIGYADVSNFGYNPNSKSLFIGGAYYASSDIRKKDVVKEISLDKAYELVEKCQTIFYTWKDDEEKQLQIGLLAQEVQEYFPELVSEGSDGYLTLDYSKLTVILLTVIRDLTARVKYLETLEERIKLLEEKLK